MTNFGGDNLTILRSGGGQTVLTDFDPISIPPETAVTKALLAYFTLKRTNPQSLTALLYALKRLWLENEATYLVARSDDPWEQPGATGPQDREQQPIMASDLAAEGWTTIDVTNVIHMWVTEPDRKKVGFLLEGATGALVAYSIASREWPEANKQPRLILQFGTYTPTPTRTATSDSTATATLSPTNTPTSTRQPTHTSTPTPTPTRTYTPSLTPSYTPTEPNGNVHHGCQHGTHGCSGRKQRPPRHLLRPK
ncbi:MAG: DNRLRE domain-containing protein [Caldilineales bacterium]|nr:DNRLRE domain-containing protein [Caldilineales bacterium]